MREWSATSIEEDNQSKCICRPWTWRLANGFMFVFFSLAAFVQINDPDPVIWVLVYMIPSVLCFAVTINTSLQDHFVWRAFAVTHLVTCIMSVFYLLTVLWTSQAGSYNPLHYEEGRETAGLLIVIFWLVLCQVTRLKRFGEGSGNLWTMITAVSVVPFVLWGYYTMTWDMSTLQSHCKDIVVQHVIGS